MYDLFAAKVSDSRGVNLESKTVKPQQKAETGFQSVLDQAYRTRDGKPGKVALLSNRLPKERTPAGELKQTAPAGELDQTVPANARSVTVAKADGDEFGPPTEALVEATPTPVKETEVEKEEGLASEAADLNALAVDAATLTPTLISSNGAISSQAAQVSGLGLDAGQATSPMVGEATLPTPAVGATDATQPIPAGLQSVMPELPAGAALTTGPTAINAKSAENSPQSLTSPPTATVGALAAIADQPAELNLIPRTVASGITETSIAANPQAAVTVTAEVAAPLTTALVSPLDDERTTMVAAELPEAAVPGATSEKETMTPFVTSLSEPGEGAAPAVDIPTEANRVAYNMVMAGVSLQKNGLGFATGKLRQPIAESLKTWTAGPQLVIPAEVILTTGDGRSMTPETKAPDVIGTLGANVALSDTAKLGSAFTDGEMAAAENHQADDSTATLAPRAALSGQPFDALEFTRTRTGSTQSVEDYSWLPKRDLNRQSGDMTAEIAVVEGSQANLLSANRVAMSAAASSVNNDEVFAQIVEEARVMVGQGQSEMELSLKPDHLGKLKLKIVVDRQIVTAHFTVESEQVKQIIETNLAQLRKQFQDTGTQIENFTVTVGQHDGGEAGYSQQSLSGGRQDPASYHTTAVTLDRSDSDQVTQVRTPAPSMAVIDLIA
jgi:hypothetical protein